MNKETQPDHGNKQKQSCLFGCVIIIVAVVGNSNSNSNNNSNSSSSTDTNQIKLLRNNKKNHNNYRTNNFLNLSDETKIENIDNQMNQSALLATSSAISMSDSYPVPQYSQKIPTHHSQSAHQSNHRNHKHHKNQTNLHQQNPHNYSNQYLTTNPSYNFDHLSTVPLHHQSSSQQHQQTKPNKNNNQSLQRSMTSNNYIQPNSNNSYQQYLISTFDSNITTSLPMPGGDFSLDIDHIKDGTDKRTTLMVRNIPNKYNQQMLLDEVNANHIGTYDFFYLPIDFKNKCNVGYCFINFLETSHILPFLNEYNGMKWKSFNSEKVCLVTFARIQGKASMVARFQNSSLLEKDDAYRPLLFYSNGKEKGLPEPFPTSNRIRINKTIKEEKN